MEVPKPQPQPFASGVPAPAPTAVTQTSSTIHGTAQGVAVPVARLRQPGPRTSILVVAGFILSILVLGIGYIVFIKPDTGPAAALFSKLFPARSGLIQLQTIELDFDPVLNSPVFLKLQHRGGQIQVPPLGKPNPFL
jgi:hypothetical protein